VTHKYGTTTVEIEPKRVVSLGYNDQDQILAFGVTPVAARYWYGDETNVIFPWAEASLTGPAPAVRNMPELDFELIASYSPDLIIAIYSGITEEEYATLSQIAPTVAQLGDYIDYGMPWEETTRLVGAALGQPERAEEIISEIEDLFTTYRAENPIFEESTVAVAAMREDGSNFALFNVEDGRARIITGLGLTIPESIIDVLDPNTFFTNFSNEQLNILNSVDVVTWLQVPFAGGRDAIEKNPLYARLRVATEGRHVFVEGDVDNAIAFNSPLSIAFTLEAIVPHLVAALDGDPTTNEPPMA
jgi:iron complex transport system substrate-binding protein